MTDPAAARRPLDQRWIDRRKSLYREWERIAEVASQARTLGEELRRRRDGMEPRYFDLWALREAIKEVDSDAR